MQNTEYIIVYSYLLIYFPYSKRAVDEGRESILINIRYKHRGIQTEDGAMTDNLGPLMK